MKKKSPSIETVSKYEDKPLRRQINVFHMMLLLDTKIKSNFKNSAIIIVKYLRQITLFRRHALTSG